VGRVGIPSVTLTPAAPCSLTFVVGLLEWGSISDYKLSNFILVSVQGHPRICLDRTTCCQMLALAADLEVIVKNTALFWSPLPWPVLLENLLQARLFARYTPVDFKATHSTTLQVETAGTSPWSCPWNCTRLLQMKISQSWLASNSEKSVEHCSTGLTRFLHQIRKAYVASH